MISVFDKNGAAALYKREFTDSLYSADYETALDYLLKYNEKFGYPDFHLACGKLYMLMAQDSDDNELLIMAFRELMMHIRKFPKCRIAYRDLLAVQMLRHDPAGALECLGFANSNGVDTEGMFDALSEAGVDLFMDESVGLDLDGLMDPGEFGEIEIIDELEDYSPAPQENRESRVLKFNGGKSSSNAEQNDDGQDTQDKVIQLNTQQDDTVPNDELNFFDDDESNDGENDLIGGFGDGEIVKREELGAQLALRDAEKYGAQGNFEKAFATLSVIKPTDGHYYYCAECLRAFIYMQTHDLDSATASLDRAFEVHPRGALASTLLCKIYETKKQYAKIPTVLKNADTKDYTDADHVYQAMMFAVKYCKPNDAIKLAQSYIDEFNTMDIRMLHAQLLYNNGKRKEATRKMYALSRLFYDDFNAQYYYKQAVADVEAMPIDEQAPQEVLARIVDGLLLIHGSGTPSDELIKSEDYQFALELFLTLELPRDRKVLGGMVAVLKDIAHDRRLEQKLRDSLVSPYVEPVVKAVILSDLFESSSEFLTAVNFLPDSDTITKIPQEYLSGFKTALAYILCMDRAIFEKAVELINKVRSTFEFASFIPSRDTAYYILKKLKSKMLNDGRVITALGFANKTEANAVFKATDNVIKKLTESKN